jgi:hypothetical protein
VAGRGVAFSPEDVLMPARPLRMGAICEHSENVVIYIVIVPARTVQIVI